MFMRIGERIINTDRIVEACVIEAYEDHYDDGGEFVPARPLRVVLSMTGLNEEGKARRISLYGAEAEMLLANLPVYEPVADNGEES